MGIGGHHPYFPIVPLFWASTLAPLKTRCCAIDEAESNQVEAAS
jgi:hypothetical protein